MRGVSRFADWLAQTPLSTAIQVNEWVIPTIQSIHIVAIGVVLGSVLMVTLRILGLAARDQTLAETNARFGPWLTGALIVLLVTGILMIVGEPARELLALSFWMKMVLVAFAVAVRPRAPALAFVTLLVWLCIVVLGRLIAYDHVWGSWSAALKG
ncbi:MAG: hypothetical protein FJW14_05930 [Acidimicrobiia bacterium]|nr:hypothetical protein [Acidimicrobiia bacterium]